MAGSSSATLVLKVVTDAKDAAKGLDQTSDSVSKFHTGMAKVGAAAAVAGTAVLAFGVSAARAAAEDAQGQAILATALKNSTGARKEDIASVETWISKTAAATGVADDELRPALATLARATSDVAESQKAMQVAMDVSVATGQDLGSVSDALAKAYAGNTASLGKLVPGIDKTVLASKDMNKIMAELARTTGGSAAAAADTAAGKMARMRLGMDEAKESIGAALLPALAVLADLLLKVSTWAQNNSQAFLILMGVIGGLAALVGAYSVAQTVAATAAGIWTAAQWLLNAALTANPIGLVIVAVAALIAGIVLIATKTRWFQDIWEAAFGAVKQATQVVFAWISSNWPLLLAILTGPIGLAVLFIVQHLDQITSAAQTVWAYLSGAFTTVWDTIRTAGTSALSAILVPLDKISSAFETVIGWIKQVIDWLSKIKIPDLGVVGKLIPGGNMAATPTVSTAPAVASRSGRASSGNVNITVNVPPTANPTETGRAVAAVLRSFVAAGGRLPVNP